MELLLDTLQVHGELVFGHNKYSPVVREELLSMSSATIDRYLKTARDNDAIFDITCYIEFWYNKQRPHSTLGYQSPQQYKQQQLQAAQTLKK